MCLHIFEEWATSSLTISRLEMFQVQWFFESIRVDKMEKEVESEDVEFMLKE